MTLSYKTKDTMVNRRTTLNRLHSFTVTTEMRGLDFIFNTVSYTALSKIVLLNEMSDREDREGAVTLRLGKDLRVSSTH